MKTTTYFVTGVSGFVGARFALNCAQKGIQVKALVRNVPKAQKKLEILGATEALMKNIQFVQGDLQRLDSNHYMELKNCDAVFHAAAKVGYFGSRLEFMRTNYQSSVMLAAMAKRAGVSRFIHLSSQAAIRPIAFSLQDKQAVLSPSTSYPSIWSMGLFHYGWAKQMAEKELMTLSDASFCVTIFRPHIIWGKGDNTLANVMLEMHAKGKLMLVNGPHRCASSQIDTLIHYADQALEIENGVPGIFHVLDRSEMTMNQWLNDYAKALGIPKPKRISYHIAYILAALIEGVGRIIAWFKPNYVPILDRFVVDGMGRSMHGDMAPTIKAFGPQPEIDINQKMQEFAAWYKDQRNTISR